jgi:hypothetical protein
VTEVKRCLNSTPRAYDINAKGDLITFRPCGFQSHYKIDIETKYCRLCQIFIEDELHDPLTDPELREK